MAKALAKSILNLNLSPKTQDLLAHHELTNLKKISDHGEILSKYNDEGIATEIANVLRTKKLPFGTKNPFVANWD